MGTTTIRTIDTSGAVRNERVATTQATTRSQIEQTDVTDPAQLQRLLRQLSQRVDDLEDRLRSNPFSNAKILRNIVLSTTNATEFAHGLGRVPIGVFPIMKSALYIFRTYTDASDPSRFIKIAVNTAPITLTVVVL